MWGHVSLPRRKERSRMKQSGKPDYSWLGRDVLRWVIAAAVSVAMIFGVNALRDSAGQATFTGTVKGESADGDTSGTAQISYRQVEAPAPEGANDVVTSAQWAELFPEIAESYNMTSENEYSVDYLEQDSYLVNLYEGYGFAKEYNAARGHAYCLEDVNAIARPHPLANCLTCKTADFTAMVNKLGAETAYALDFEEVFPQMTENVGCYTCHENQVGDNGKLVVTHDYIINQLGSNMDSMDPVVLSCGQCHIEYYFKPDDSHATTVPYHAVEEMSPDAILEYYDAMDFADWTQESTGARLLKAQHPEMETFLGEGSVHAGMGLNCADCHMEVVTNDEGYTYTNHAFVSPIESENIMSNVCAACHKDTDLVAKVHDLQAEITARETEVGNKLSELNDRLTEAVASGSYSEGQLDELRRLYRSAQWYFDFDYVENSEGAHNSKLANYCLDTSEQYIQQANDLF